jgi:hypothetical protein
MGEPEVELPEDESKRDLLTQENAIWNQYCEVKKNDEPHEFLRPIKEDEDILGEGSNFYDQHYDDKQGNFDSEHETNQNEILSEIHEDQENYARSEEEGWYYE